MAEPTRDAERDALPGDGRDETQMERLDRNWNEILQELRVTQTGSQILTGFLLTIPFQSRFPDLNDRQVTIYLVLVVLAALATLLALTPVIVHRILFRQRAKQQLVDVANVLLRLTFVALAFTLAGTTMLIFDVVLGMVAGIVAASVTLVFAVAAWVALPGAARRMRERLNGD